MAVCQQVLEVDRLAISLSAQGLVVVGKAGVVQAPGGPHALRQRPEDGGVGPGLAHGRDGGAVQQHIGVAIRGVHIPMLQLGGGGQHVVGQVGRVGHEVLQHHGEQVVAHQAPRHLGRLRRHRQRVAVVHDQRFNRALGGVRLQAQQGVADGRHVDAARLSRAQQVGARQRVALHGEVA